ncbi:MAG: phosphotransferase [Myxococcota bacterium]|nr:phosphotransferase [Myxococcota bacterium]
MRSAAEHELEGRIEALCVATLSARPLHCRPIAAGLGARRFYRVALDIAPFSLIARCERPEDPALRPVGAAAEPPLEPLRSLLERAGLPVPRLHASDPEHGIALLEDLGDTTLESAARSAAPAERRALYAQACALLPRLQALEASGDDVPNFARRLDAALLRYKADQVCQWLVPCATGKPTTAAEREVVANAFSEIESATLEAPQRLAHRDFKAQNLHLVDDSEHPDAVRGAPRLVMIDLQGAFLAPPEYDLVCLLRDLHVELAADEIQDQLERVRTVLPDAPARADLQRRFALLTLSRVGKDLARFVYAVRERGDTRYRAFLPTGVRHLKSAAAASAGWCPALARFADLIAQLPESPCAP